MGGCREAALSQFSASPFSLVHSLPCSATCLSSPMAPKVEGCPSGLRGLLESGTREVSSPHTHI